MDVWQPTPQKKMILNLPAHGRDGDRRTSTPTRSSGSAATSRPRLHRSSACIRTTTAAPASPPPSSASWPAPTGSRARCSAMASAPAMSMSITLALNLFSQGIDPGAGDHRHRRDRPHRRILQPAAGASAPSLCRRAGLHRVFRARIRTRSRRASTRSRSATTICGRCPICRSTPRIWAAPTRR